jgi:hypothetical protein
MAFTPDPSPSPTLYALTPSDMLNYLKKDVKSKCGPDSGKPPRVTQIK